MWLPGNAAVVAAALFFAADVWGAVARQGVTVGEIVSAKGDETVRYAGSATWQRVEVGQRLLSGDVLKTGPYGALSILFQDDTQIRLHRNSTFEIGDIRGTGQTGVSRFKLLTGSAWSRAKSLFRSVSATLPTRVRVLEMTTPTATIGIRGTDWHVVVKNGGETAVTVLSGEVDFFNDLGAVAVRRGEQGIAVAGQPPTKRVIVDVRDRPLMVLEFEPRWFEMLVLSDATTVAQFLDIEKRVESTAAEARSAAQWLTLARARLDRGDLQGAEKALAQAKKIAKAEDAGVQLVEGMLLARRNERERARPLLQRAAQAARGRDQVLTRLGLAGLEFEAQEYARAGAMVDKLVREHPDNPEAQLYRPVLAFYAGAQERALKLASEGERRFPQDARFAAITSAFHLVRGDDADMKQAFERALALDPDQPLALNLEGIYYHEIDPDADRAEQAYRRSLAVNDYAESWNNLALLQQELGDFDAAEASFKRSLEADPDYALAMTNYAMLLMLLDRLDEAQVYLDTAQALKPGNPSARLVSGFMTLVRGEPRQAVEEIQKAVVTNPSEPQAYSLLSYAQYQAERFAEADEAIELAREADPDDPVPLVVGSIMAQDQAQAGKAIRYAREGLEKIRKLGSFAVEDIVNTRSGASNVGSAYANLDLDDWGRYYAQSVFTQYDASSHFFLSNVYPSARAQQGEAGQGLLLDTLAGAASNRYFDFIRQPKSYLSIGGSAGAEDGAHTDSAFGSIQGFARLPAPVAYNVTASRSHNDGFRTNVEQQTESVLMGLGTRFNSQKDHLIAIFGATRAVSGLAGDARDPDPDDESELQRYAGSLGWHHRFNYDNRLLARVALGSTLTRTTNAIPFGQGFDELTFSLIRAFGLEGTRALVDTGLFDATAVLGFPSDPALLTDSAPNRFACTFILPALCATPFTPALPARVDTNPVGVLETESHEFDLQLRHMLDFGKGIEFTYGLEWTPQEQENRADALVFIQAGTGLLIPDVFNIPLATAFPFGSAQPLSIKDAGPVTGAQAYTQARWKMRDNLWTEGGVFVRYYDDETEDQTSVDPRIGIAWEPMRGQWLRAAYQREMGIPTPLNGTLAPVAAAGLVISDKLLLTSSEVIDDVQARWDAEWLPGLFSFVQFEHQDIDAYGETFPFSLLGFNVGGAEADELSFGVNTWFLERFGAFARYRHTWSENTAGNANHGNDLPLQPEHEFDLGLSWIHPRQIRAAVVGSYVGERWGDVANTLELDGYFTVSASVNWQPMHRHWSFTLAAVNLFDEDYDFAPGVPAPGTTAAISAEYRF